MFRAFDLAGEWAIDFDRHDGVKCFAVATGECWLRLEGDLEAVRLRSGDCFLLPRGHAFRIASDLTVAPSNAASLFQRLPDAEVAVLNGGGSCSGMGGHFAFAGEHADILLGLLPSIVHIGGEPDRAMLRWSVERMMQELSEPKPGGSMIAHQLASMILVQALRLHLAESPDGSTGWLFALSDKRMNAAISAMHRDPARRWTLDSLAKAAAMSRSTFAARFKQKTAVSPMDYLARWRMLLACDRLVNLSEPVSAIALSLGYQSESAFSTAFKRTIGISPRSYAETRGLRTGIPARK